MVSNAMWDAVTGDERAAASVRPLILARRAGVAGAQLCPQAGGLVDVIAGKRIRSLCGASLVSFGPMQHSDYPYVPGSSPWRPPA